MINTAKNISSKELFTRTIPRHVENLLSRNVNTSSLDGTTRSFVFDVSGKKYNYMTYNGKKIRLNSADIKNPMVRIKISREDLEKMIATQNLDTLVGIQSNLTLAKYNTIKRLSGSMLAELDNDDGSKYNIEIIFNDVEKPRSIIKMKTVDSKRIIQKEIPPLHLYILGGLKVEGDSFFALNIESLFR